MQYVACCEIQTMHCSFTLLMAKENVVTPLASFREKLFLFKWKQKLGTSADQYMAELLHPRLMELTDIINWLNELYF